MTLSMNGLKIAAATLSISTASIGANKELDSYRAELGADSRTMVLADKAAPISSIYSPRDPLASIKTSINDSAD